MIAFYIHWHYPVTADAELFYGGKDDDKLFYHKVNAKKYAKDKINEWNNNVARFKYLDDKDNNFGLNPEEQEEWRKLLTIYCSDLPDDYTVREREIKFEDEL